MLDLFEGPRQATGRREPLAAGAVVLRGFALDAGDELLAAVREVAEAAPFRHMVTPGGFTMSVAMTNCGSAGWVTDRTGYRYDAIDPVSGKPWPPMPPVFSELAGMAAAEAGFEGFAPDACLINRYEPGAKLSLHQDKNEADFDRADRLRLARIDGGVPVRRPEPGRPPAQGQDEPWRCRGLGRPGPPLLPWRDAAEGRVASDARASAPQPDAPQGALICPVGGRLSETPKPCIVIANPRERVTAIHPRALASMSIGR